MVEIFKTNVSTKKQAKHILLVLKSKYPNAKLNFDIEDIDRILRVQDQNISITALLEDLHQLNIEAIVLV